MQLLEELGLGRVRLDLRQKHGELLHLGTDLCAYLLLLFLKRCVLGVVLFELFLEFLEDLLLGFGVRQGGHEVVSSASRFKHLGALRDHFLLLNVAHVKLLK